MSRLKGCRAHVVGGGIGGMTTALALASLGASVFVFERADAIREVGAGIQITPNAGRVLQTLDLWETVRKAGVVSEAVVPTDALTGRAIARFNLSGQSPRYIFIHRAKLIAALAETCAERGVTLTLGAAVTGADDKGRLAFAEGGGSEKQDAADLIVFADGIRSVGRPLLNGAGDPQFTGQVAWRALVPSPHPPEARIHMAPGRHLVTYPLGPNLTNLVAVQERAAWADEGWSHRDDPENLRRTFADCGEAVRGMLSEVTDVHLWGLFRHEIAETWAEGRMAILGDAAHPTLPFLAQGANLAIEDAYVLARCCGGSGVAVGLRAYEAERKPRVARAIAAANANARNYHLGGLRRGIAHAGLRVLGRTAPDAFLRRLSWLYDHDVTQAEEAPA